RPGHLATCGASGHLPRRITPNPLHLCRVAGCPEISVIAVNSEMDRSGHARAVATVGRDLSRPLVLERLHQICRSRNHGRAAPAAVAVRIAGHTHVTRGAPRV